MNSSAKSPTDSSTELGHLSQCVKSWVTLRVEKEISIEQRWEGQMEGSSGPQVHYEILMWVLNLSREKERNGTKVKSHTWDSLSWGMVLIIVRVLVLWGPKSPLLKETSWFSKMSSVPGCSCIFVDNCPHMRDGLSWEALLSLESKVMTAGLR